ncbi:hypothetical protein ACFQZ4_34810 [Catellatospora coxensis]|uniref:hypothetical protein n=1 Tax=Catellatospora coxensis TaxID=310354 RepID=UPI0019419903|nr:hypothetical protein [Catellatospora coxensis]
MGNSTVYRIYTSDDLGTVYAKTRRLLDLRSPTCCRSYVSAYIELDTHRDLARYLPLDRAHISADVPAELFDQVAAVLDPHLPATRRMARGRDGSAYLMAGLSNDVIAALSELPQLEATVFTREHELHEDPADLVVAAVGTDPASLSWRVCWHGRHNGAGFELGLNGVEMWHRDPVPGHSLYVHVGPDEEELAQGLARAVRGGILGEAASGW